MTTENLLTGEMKFRCYLGSNSSMFGRYQPVCDISSAICRVANRGTLPYEALKILAATGATVVIINYHDDRRELVKP